MTRLFDEAATLSCRRDNRAPAWPTVTFGAIKDETDADEISAGGGKADAERVDKVRSGFPCAGGRA